MLPKFFDLIPIVSSIGQQKQLHLFRRKQIIFSHGDHSYCIFYIEKGTVKLTVTAATGKEAFLAMLGKGDFFGDSLLNSAEERLIRVLSSLKRLAKGREAGPVPRVSQQDLANMIGVSRQRINSLLHQLTKS